MQVTTFHRCLVYILLLLVTEGRAGFFGQRTKPKPAQSSQNRPEEPKIDYFAPENRDPSRADPDGAITCLGPLPPVVWPEFLRVMREPHYEPWRFSLQQLCAKPQYGGAPRGHLGGWCWDPWSSNAGVGQVNLELRKDRGFVLFDTYQGTGSSSLLGIPRLQAYCQQHCHCTTPGNDSPPRKKKYEVRSKKLESWEGEQVNPDIDAFKQKDAAVEQPNGTPTVVQVKKQKQVWDPNRRQLAENERLYLAPQNRITCKGDLPDFGLPQGWSKTDFGNNQALCANAMDGGLRDANAGAFCNTKELVLPAVDFSDELTPALNFKIIDLAYTTSEDRRRAHAVRTWCLFKCTCIQPTPTPTPQPVQGQVLQVHDNVADIVVVQTNNGLATTKTYRLVGAETNACKTPEGRSQACLPVLPDSLLPIAAPAIHTAPPAVDTVARSSRAKCGTSCSRYGDCQGNGQPQGCQCVVNPSPFQARLVGADPVGTTALCLVSSLFISQLQGVKGGSTSLLNGRDVEDREPRDWWDQPDLPCACNSTYVSKGCCLTTTGIIWEHPSLRMGRLA